MTKKSYFADRRLELVSLIANTHPRRVVECLMSRDFVTPSFLALIAARILSHAFGAISGRWKLPRTEVDHSDDLSTSTCFAALPPYPRPLKLPSGDEGVNNDPAVIVDDEGHSLDIVSKLENGPEGVDTTLVEEAVALPLGDSARGGAVRTYFRTLFFADHIRTYSKSRRKAPIYWQLATPSASYSVWCYYHRLTRDTFFRVANDYVAPKVDHEERRLNTLRQEAGPDPSSNQREEIDAQETFVAELHAFLTEVKRIAPLWNPNLNDGVIINYAPLWRLVPQHKAWQKECKKVWDKLVNGDYDWAHLAMHLWPERVVPKCQDDRSLAIAHGLEDDFWYEDDEAKKTVWKKRQVSSDRVTELVAERASTAVKAALQDLLEAPTPTGTARRKRSAKA